MPGPLSICEHAYIMEKRPDSCWTGRRQIAENADVREFLPGPFRSGKKKSYREIKHYKRRKRWLG